MSKAFIALLLTGVLLAGCGEVVVFGRTVHEASGKTQPSPAATPAATPAAKPAATAVVAPAKPAPTVAPAVSRVSALSVTLTPQAAQQAGKDSRFSVDALRDAIKAELQSHGVLTGDSPGAGTAEVSIDDYTLQPSTNFAIFGGVPHAGKLHGNLVLRDTQGQASPGRRIEVQSKVTIPQSGATDKALQPLYRAFAARIVSTITGVPEPTVAEDQPPR